MSFIKWVTGKIYPDPSGMKTVRHMFEIGEDRLYIDNLSEGHYPPFTCVNLEIGDAIKMKWWLEKIIQKNCEIQLKNVAGTDLPFMALKEKELQDE